MLGPPTSGPPPGVPHGGGGYVGGGHVAGGPPLPPQPGNALHRPGITRPTGPAGPMTPMGAQGLNNNVSLNGNLSGMKSGGPPPGSRTTTPQAQSQSGGQPNFGSEMSLRPPGPPSVTQGMHGAFPQNQHHQPARPPGTSATISTRPSVPTAPLGNGKPAEPVFPRSFGPGNVSQRQPGPPTHSPGLPRPPMQTNTVLSRPHNPGQLPLGVPAVPPASVPHPAPQRPSVGFTGQSPLGGQYQVPPQGQAYMAGSSRPPFPPGPPGGGVGQMPPNPAGPVPGQTGVPPVTPGAPTGYPPQPHAAAPNGYGGTAAPRRTLDPDQMPSPIHVIEEDQRANSGYFETREKGLTPPLVTTKFITRDYGNASPRFIRSTMYNVPATPEMMKQTGVPFGLVISPFAPVQEGEIEPPVSDFGPTGPVRCVRCKAYMCPFMQFVDGGRRFQCAFCKATTEVPQEYFQHLDHNGQRLDHFQRPELCLGAYECIATKDYCRDSVEPQTPGVIFAIDVSYPMVKEGIVNLICHHMKEILTHLPKDENCNQERMKVGFMTYDSKVHFYNLNKGLSQPQQLNVGDVEEVFVPLVEGFLVDAEDSGQVIDALMEQIPTMFGQTRETETILGPVVQAGKEAFKAANCSGKLIIFHHNLPVAEAPGKLKNRDDRKLLGSDKEKNVLMPQNKFYNELGQECVGVGCSVDLFLFNNAYIDVATLSQVSRLTGGQLYKYTYFQPDIDGERFIEDLKKNLSRPVVFDAIMRVRTSTGVRPVDFFGSFFMANTTDTELASMNADSAIACEIKHDDKLTEEDGVFIQAAILFTSCSGQRRLRVLNLSLSTGTSMADTYRNCELDTIINFTAKQSISRLMDTNPKAVKENLINNCAHVLACYRKNCASPSSAGQLILPECMKLLPLYTNCLIKSDAISGGPDVGCDDRAFLMSAVCSMDVSSTVGFFYPRLYSIHDLNTNESGLPNQIRCSIEKIRDDGIYILENGIYLFLYVGLAADPNLVRDIFGAQSVAAIDVDRTVLETRENPMSQRLREIIQQLRQQRPRFMRLIVVRQRDKLDILFRHYLCEDRTGNDGNFSYVDFLCHMHKEIRALLG